MSRDTLKARLVDMATAVRGTEAVAFVNEQPGDELRSVLHLRPGDSDSDTRDRAISAFREIIAPCVAAQKDGVICVSDVDESAPDPQYCLVVLVREKELVSGAVAVITRCRNDETAVQKLTLVQRVAAGA